MSAARSADGDDDGRASRIDVHHHCAPPVWVKWAEEQELLPCGRLPAHARWDEDRTLAMMDAAGIATAVLSPTMPCRYHTTAQRKESIAVAVRAVADLAACHVGRFAFFVPLPLDDAALAAWALRYGLALPGAVGVSMRAHYGGVYLGDPVYDRVFAELDERAAVVNTHPHALPHLRRPEDQAVPGIPSSLCDFLLDTTRAAVNMIAHRTVDRCPRLSVILPHAGGFLPYMAARLEVQGNGCTPPVDSAQVQDCLERFHYDTAGPMYPTPATVAALPAGRVLFGTDWPVMPAGTLHQAVLPRLDDASGLTTDQRRAVNRENAARLMPGLSPPAVS